MGPQPGCWLLSGSGKQAREETEAEAVADLTAFLQPELGEAEWRG